MFRVLNRYWWGAIGFVGVAAALTAARPAAAQFTFVTNFTKTNNIQNALIQQFPTGVFNAANSLDTPFDIVSDINGKNFYDGGGTLSVNVSLPDVTHVYMLFNAYAPPAGANVATVTFSSSGGATQSFTLQNGVDDRDFYQGSFANAINGTTTQNAYTINNTIGGGGTGNSSTGLFGTYHVDEVNFTLAPAFFGQTLTNISVTQIPSGGTPIVLGITTVAAPEPGSVALLLLGAPALGIIRRRRK